MYLTRLHVKNFRNYRELTLDLGPGVTVFLANNGSGKTNILESIFYLSQLKSHRLGGDEVLVRRDADLAQVIARVTEMERSQIYEAQIPKVGRRSLLINKNAISQTRRFRNGIKVVLFAPEDLKLVREDPTTRRDELDQLLAALSPSDSNARAAFDKVLRQRNSLLKSIAKALPRDRGNFLSSLPDWNEKYAEIAAEVVVTRQQTIAALQPKLAEIYSELTEGHDQLGIGYVPKSVAYSSLEDPVLIQKELSSALMRFQDVEMARGITMVGPHRDDLDITINQMLARTHASQGEAWSVALAWRVAVFDLLTARHDSPPILLLDDVFTQLDAKRRELLQSRFKAAQQVLITTAVASDVPNGLWNHRFEIKNDEVIAIS